MIRRDWTALRRVVSVPLLGAGALLLLMLSTGWLSLLRTADSRFSTVAILVGGTTALLAAGFLLWGRSHRVTTAGVLFLAVGCQTALVAAVFALALRGDLGALFPAEIDPALYRAMAAGSAVSAFGLVGVGFALLAPAIARLVRRIRSIEEPIFAWVVLAWQAHVAVTAAASILFARSYGDILPAETRQFLAEHRPHAVPASVALAALGLVAAFFLVRRRKIALWLFVAQFALHAVDAVFFRGLELPPALPIPGFLWTIGWAHAAVIEIAILGYVGGLHRRDVLR